MSDCWSSSRVSDPDSGDQSCRRDKLVRFDFPAGELAAGASSKSVLHIPGVVEKLDSRRLHHT
jgi:hypothetical protein